MTSNFFMSLVKMPIIECHNLDDIMTSRSIVILNMSKNHAFLVVLIEYQVNRCLKHHMNYGQEENTHLTICVCGVV